MLVTGTPDFRIASLYGHFTRMQSSEQAYLAQQLLAFLLER